MEGLYLAAFMQTYIKMSTHQNARASHCDIAIDGTISYTKVPPTFRNLQAILVQMKLLPSMSDLRSFARISKGREGDGVVARGEAGEDARVEVKHAISTSG